MGLVAVCISLVPRVGLGTRLGMHVYVRALRMRGFQILKRRVHDSMFILRCTAEVSRQSQELEVMVKEEGESQRRGGEPQAAQVDKSLSYSHNR